MPYKKGEALKGCALVQLMYEVLDQWKRSGRPAESKFQWAADPAAYGFDCFSGLLWTQASAYRRKPGGPGGGKIHYEWVSEVSPMIIGASSSGGDALYLGVRGTGTTREWDTNVRFTPLPCKFGDVSLGGVHKGFRDTLESCGTRLIDALRELAARQNGARRVVITGHSLGGAVAVLAGARICSDPWFKEAGLERVTVYTVGSPRVGNALFGTALESLGCMSVYNIQNLCDPVPTLPPEALSFCHAGKVLTFSQDMGSAPSNHALPLYMQAITQDLMA